MAEILQTSRKQCWKMRNCLLLPISPFPKVFSKDLYCRQKGSIPGCNRPVFKTGTSGFLPCRSEL